MEYIKWNERFENNDSERASIRARFWLSQMRNEVMLRRKEIFDKRTEIKQSRKEARQQASKDI
jgi:hypothetical protein